MSEFTETTVIEGPPAGRNPLVLVLAIVGAIVAGALIWFFVAAPLLAGDDPDDAVVPSAAAPDSGVADATPADEPVVDETPETALPVVTYEVFLDRDPFEPVVPEPTAATTPIDGTDPSGTGGQIDDTTDGGTTDGAVTDGTMTDGTDGTGGQGGGTASGCSEGEQLVCDGRVVSLVDVRTDDDGERLAVVQVDTTLYEVRVGDTFAGSFRVQSITADHVFLLYGDDAFELAEGDRVLK